MGRTALAWWGGPGHPIGMARIEVRHEAGDRYAAVVRGHRLVVDQPVDAGGLDAGPTPTELFVASLASCAAHYAGRFLQRHGLPDGELAVEADFTMSLEAPSRVTSIALRIALPDVPEPIRAGALRAAERCTVHNSISRAPRIEVTAARATVAA